MHSSEFSTDVLLAKWRAQESMAQGGMKKKSEDSKGHNNQEAEYVWEEERDDVGMMGQERVIVCVGSLVHTQINISSNSTERILGFCSGFSESQMETPSTTSRANPSGFT